MLRFVIALSACLASPVAAQISGPVHVVDGDTLRLGGITIRLHGIDAPETAQTCRTEHGVDWACGRWVTNAVRAAYQGKPAICAPITQDRYGRTVATCDVSGQDMGQHIVSQGWAFAYRRYSLAYDLDEKAAAVNDRGLHGFHVQNPAQFRVTRAKGRVAPDPSCPIKGNISANGRIFHVPGQRDYDATGINLARAERWFCSEVQARAAGWRKAKR